MKTHSGSGQHLLELFTRFQDLSGIRSWGASRSFAFGPFCLTLRFSSTALEETFLPAIEHAEVDKACDALEVRIADMAGVEDALFDWLSHELPTDVDIVMVSGLPDRHAAWHPASRTLECTDTERREAIVASASPAQIPSWELAAPFRRILHWSALSTPHCVVHAATLSHAGRGLLLTGMSGSGKSTTTARALGSGFQSAGDDMVLIDPTGARPGAIALYDVVKVDAALADELPFGGKVNWSDIESHGGKKMCRISDISRELFAPRIDLDAVLVPELSGEEESRIEPAEATDALRALAPSTMQILRGGEQATLSKMAALVKHLPCFRFHLGTDPDHLLRTLQAFCEEFAE